MSKTDGEMSGAAVTAAVASECVILRGTERIVREAMRLLNEIADMTQNGDSAFVAIWVDGEKTDYLETEIVATWIEDGKAGIEERPERCRTATCESGKARRGRSTGRSPQRREPS